MVNPDATVDGVPGISLRDEPWEEAEKLIIEAWMAGYCAMHIDDGVLLYKPNVEHERRLARNESAQTFGRLELKLMLTTAKELWWISEEGTK